jgi:hypothetical protein
MLGYGNIDIGDVGTVSVHEERGHAAHGTIGAHR